MKEIKIKELKELAREQYMLIDIRDEGSIMYGMMPGAIPIAFRQFEEDMEIVIIPAKEGDDRSTVAESMHKALIIKNINENKGCNCINCGKYITDKKAFLVEIDNEEVSGVAGLVHTDCVRPIDRVMGECELKISDELTSRQ